MSGRWALVALWGGSVIAALLLPGPAPIVAELGDPRAEVVVGAAISIPAAALSWLLAGWGSLAVTMGVLARLPSTAGAAARWVLTVITPVAARRAVGLALGLAVLGSAPAYAAAPGLSPGSDHAMTNTTGLPVIAVDLDWPMDLPDTDPGRDGARGRNVDDAPGAPEARTVPYARAKRPEAGVPAARTVVTVAPGDCLWAIAANHLPMAASPAQIDAAWRSWYRENRDVIGSDPDLLTPGQRLRAPADPITAATGAAAHHRGGSS